MTAWQSHGCERCRHEWYDHSGPELVLQKVADNLKAMTMVHRCSVCGAYWGSGPGVLPFPLADDEALRLIETAGGER